MPARIDHLILGVRDAEASIAFYTQILGFTPDGTDGPFSVIRVTPDFVILLAPWGTDGGEHLAFAMSRAEFESVFERVKAASVPYGDSYHRVGNQEGPGEELGARGMGPTLYFNDPNDHLIEIRHYGD